MKIKSRILIAFLIIILLSACNSTPPKTAGDKKSASTSAVSLPERTMELHFIDVGQGDCILVHTETNNILFDAGNASDAATIGNYLHSLGVNKLDAFVGTHPHEDHLGSGAYIVREFDIDEIIMTDHISTSFFFEKLLDAIEEKGMTVSLPQVGSLRKFGDISIKFLSPKVDYGNPNDNSIVTRIDFGETSALLMGDAEKSVEDDLLSEDEPLDVDVLKVGHHGSRYASSEDFLKAVSPKFAVIQSGEGNSYGHPHVEATQRLENCGAEVYRCDKEGTIVLRSNAKSFERIEKAKPKEIEKNYIANIRSKKFHLPQCNGLPEEQNREYFESREAAIKKGYSPCGNCKP